VKVLLDTHALIWWFNDPAKLSSKASSILKNPETTILVSAVVAWEMAIKVNLGKLNALPLITDLVGRLVEEGFTELPISVEQAVRAGLLPRHHRDPFDRLLVAQAQDMNVPVLSGDVALDRYDVSRLW
jgi:PIN domain nuclease of toxin-antitoxin system